ncbi:hypothetical protein Vau01_100310 [Virgisporangium aurantiacum]|uniref:SEFIR domain-containing protein n=1 Tax=Virgisporangium aurantiacum TaxID=175570 RepID=A0A8J4E503_9ACTN|nr:hypothetical protein Vau01_100310 [Virgisporangium aurantiacum]
MRLLWTLLRAEGVDARLDVSAASERRFWPQWMSEQIRLADFVLVVASPRYRERAEGRAAGGVGRGVWWEARQLQELLYTDSDEGIRMILPVILPGDDATGLPDWLHPVGGTTYVVSTLTSDGVDELVRVLTCQPLYVEPPLGTVRPRPPRVSMAGGEISTSAHDADIGSTDAEPSPTGTGPRRSGGRQREWRRPWMAPGVEPGMVPRPDLGASLVSAVCHPAEPATVAVTAVQGTGGFGKTTLVAQAIQDPAVVAWYTGGLLWTELGRDVTGPALAAKINDLTEALTMERPTMADPQQAGFRLGVALDACTEPVLLVIDDVWRDEQIHPFLVGGRTCRRLVTTRHRLRSLAGSVQVLVDAMDDGHATELLTRGLGAVPSATVTELLRLTGRWPLLLDITNRTIAQFADNGRDTADAASIIAEQLGRVGPAGLDNPYQISDQQRHRMVAACLNASIDLLPALTRDRYRELCIFAEDTDIPFQTLNLLWGAGAAMTEFQVEQLGRTLVDASLARPARHVPGLRLHDVIRTFLQASVGHDRLVGYHRTLLTSVGRLLQPQSFDPIDAGSWPWWTVPDDLDDLRRHLVDHLRGAGLDRRADDLVADLRWASARIRRDGPVAVEADLRRSSTATAAALGTAIRQNAHLLTPIRPAHAIDDILASRLDASPPLQPLVADFTPYLTERLRVVNRWPPPDQPDAALRRAIDTGHPYGVSSVHLAPDKSLMITTGAAGRFERGNGPVMRIFDLANGIPRHAIDTGHLVGVGSVHLASDGSWLATKGTTGPSGVGGDPMIQIFDPESGTVRHTIDTGHHHGVALISIAPDRSWLATAGTLRRHKGDPVVRIFDPATGALRQTIDTGHHRGVGSVHVAPDGSWIATVGTTATGWEENRRKRPNRRLNGDPVVHILDPMSGLVRQSIDTRHPRGVASIYVAPDGSWLATTGTSESGDPVVRIIDIATGTIRHAIDTGHADGVDLVHVAPDGSWLATIGTGRYRNSVVRIFDTASGTLRHTIDTGHLKGVGSIYSARDPSWLATRGVIDARGRGDRVVRIFDTSGGALRDAIDTGHPRGVRSVFPAADGSWLATTGTDRDPVVRIFDTSGGALRHAIDTGHPRGVRSVFPAADGSWLATTGTDRDPLVRIFDTAVGTSRNTGNPGHRHEVGFACLASDGSWLATTGTTGDIRSGFPVVRIFDPATGKMRHNIDTGHPRGVDSVHMARDGSWLATAGPGGVGGDPVARLFDPISGALRYTIDTGHRRGVGSIHLADDRSWLATTGAVDSQGRSDPNVHIFDPASGALRHSIDTGFRRGAGSLYPAPDGSWLATTSTTGPGGLGGDPVIRILDPNSGTHRHTIDTGHPHGVGSLYLAPDGSWLATTGAGGLGGDPMIRIYDPISGTPRHTIDTTHHHGIRWACLAPDGTWLATIGAGGVDGDPILRIFDPANGSLRHSIDTGHTHGIGAMHVASDGTWLATTGTRGADSDPVVRIVDPASGTLRYAVDTGLARGVDHLVILPADGRLVAAGKSSIFLWQAQTGRAAAMRIDDQIKLCSALPSSNFLLLVSSRGVFGFDVIET